MKKTGAFFSLILLLVSCQPKQENKSSASVVYSAERDIFHIYLANRMSKFDELAPGLMLFDATLPNDPNKVFNYHLDTQMAANAGVYMADLYYSVLTKTTDVSVNYIKAVAGLSKALGVEKLPVDNLATRYNKNLENYDSIKSIATQLFKLTTEDLETKHERLAGIMMATYQIENLHLALSILPTFPEILSPDEQETKDLLQRNILSQQSNIEIIYNFLRSTSDPLDPQRNPNYPFYDTALRDLIGIYQDIPDDTQADPQINKQTLSALTSLVTEIRTKIISVE
ncbi:MAG: hypothetical protein KBF45_02050 [Cyclobacteriaceae bacterium]|jgi:hypothetical protein|nr:hypothetical protein [Cyclobacteriaceae bacterium]